MSNTIKIKEIKTWGPTGEKSIDYLGLSNFNSYNFDNSGGKVEYKLIGVDEIDGATDYFTGVVDIPSEVIVNWGTDDNIIFEYVANALGVTIDK
jgi:hypothetical protein